MVTPMIAVSGCSVRRQCPAVVSACGHFQRTTGADLDTLVGESAAVSPPSTAQGVKSGHEHAQRCPENARCSLRITRLPRGRAKFGSGAMAARMLCVAVLLLIVAQVSAGTPDVQRIEGRLQLRKILEDSAAWVVYYHDGEEIELPRGEGDTREAAWFAKLAQLWERDVRHGRVPWAADSMTPLKFASADRSTLLADGASDLFDSEFADLPLGPRLYENSGDRGPMPRPMNSRQAMQTVLKYLDTELADGRPSGSLHEEL